MAITIEKRLLALETTHLNQRLSVTVRFVTEKPTPQQRAEHAALRAAGVELLVVTFVPSKEKIDA